MARKTRSCRKAKVHRLADAIRIQVCIMTRGHGGRCWDGAEAFDVDA